MGQAQAAPLNKATQKLGFSTKAVCEEYSAIIPATSPA